MAFAGAGVAERDDVLAAQNLFAARQFQNQHLVERGDRRRVEAIERLNRWKARGADLPFDHTSFAIDEFEFGEAEQIARMIGAVLRALARNLLVLQQELRQP